MQHEYVALIVALSLISHRHRQNPLAMTSTGRRSIIAAAVLVVHVATTIRPACLALARADGLGTSPAATTSPDPSPLLASSGRLWRGLAAPSEFAPRSAHAPLGFAPFSADDAPAPAAAGEAAAGAPAETALPSPALAESDLGAARSHRGSWWVWAGSAALLGAFLAGFAYDLANDPTSESNELPYFPDTP
jgi:hypothetical protein